MIMIMAETLIGGARETLGASTGVCAAGGRVMVTG
jgi:hypothetical protein